MTDGLEELGLPPLGHNKPPEPSIIDRVRDLIGNCNRWLAERPAIIDADMAGAAQTFTEQLRAARDDLDVEQKALTQPHDDAIAAIKATFRDPRDMVKIALDAMGERNKAWLKRESDRLDAERLARLQAARDAAIAAEKADRAAQKPGASVEAQLAAQRASEAAEQAIDSAQRVPVRAQTRGDYASKAMSLHANWKARIVDADAALKHYAGDDDVRRAALDAVVKKATKLAKGVKGDQKHAPPGIHFWNDERAQ